MDVRRCGVLALGAAIGLFGLRWGLPGAHRLVIFPESKNPTPEVADKLAKSWGELYEGIERVHREVKGEEPVTYVKGVRVRPALARPSSTAGRTYSRRYLGLLQG